MIVTISAGAYSSIQGELVSSADGIATVRDGAKLATGPLISGLKARSRKTELAAIA